MKFIEFYYKTAHLSPIATSKIPAEIQRMAFHNSFGNIIIGGDTNKVKETKYTPIKLTKKPSIVFTFGMPIPFSWKAKPG